MRKPVSDEVLAMSTASALSAGLKPTLACAEAVSHTDFRPDLASFKVSTLIIHGTSDKTFPIEATGRAAAQGIANSELLEYEGEPYGLNMTASDRLTRDLLVFLSHHRARGDRKAALAAGVWLSVRRWRAVPTPPCINLYAISLGTTLTANSSGTKIRRAPPRKPAREATFGSERAGNTRRKQGVGFLVLRPT
ncbi:MAG: alpha/beta hydrolase [Rhodanobacter sp.]